MDTIYALATAQGKSGIAVIRVSGPDAFRVSQHLAGHVPEARRARLCALSGADGQLLDKGLVLTFESGASFTGEDIVEFHIHGSVATVKAVLGAIGACPNVRLADPGEFTRRALINDRLNLTEVEGLADLIDAETEAQRKQALRVFSGAIGARAEGWRSSLIRALALTEVTIDFADEEVPVDTAPEVLELLTTVISETQQELSGYSAAERIRNGFEVAIVGPPNVGKSTLLNALAGRDAAIVTDIAGTTRDVIEVRMDLGGIPVTVLDTAGLRYSDDPVESIGISRAVVRAKQADLRIFLTDGTPIEDLKSEPDDIVVKGKADLLEDPESGVSGKTGQGLNALLETMTSVFLDRSASAGLVVHERQRTALARALEPLQEAKAEMMLGEPRTEVASEFMHRAVHQLDVLVGRVDVENVLDEIFSSFCLGK